MTQSHDRGTGSRVGFGVLIFGLGSAFGLLIALACIGIAAIFGLLLIRSAFQERTADEALLDAHVELSLGDDGCHVVRGEVEGSTPVRSLTWVIKDMDGYTLLERNAEGEYETKFFRGGQYRVYVSAWYDGQYHQISDEVIVDCPQGP